MIMFVVQRVLFCYIFLVIIEVFVISYHFSPKSNQSIRDNFIEYWDAEPTIEYSEHCVVPQIVLHRGPAPAGTKNNTGVVSSTSNVTTTTASNTSTSNATIAAFNSTSNNSTGNNTTPASIVEEFATYYPNDIPAMLDEPEIDLEPKTHWLTERHLRDPYLKKYGVRKDGFEFAPPWTYTGGKFIPSTWHKLDTIYFMRPANITENSTFNKFSHRSHLSSMNLCSKKVISVMKPKLALLSVCRRLIKNECAGILPSPRMLVYKHAYPDQHLDDFQFMNFGEKYGFTLFFPEDGTDLLMLKLITPASLGSKPSVMHPQLTAGGELFLDRIIIHLGDDTLTGSEHTIEGMEYGFELQFFFTLPNLTYWEALAQYKVMPEERLNEFGFNVLAMSVLVNVTGTKAHPYGAGNVSKEMDILGHAARMFWTCNNVDLYRAIQISKPVLILDEFFGDALKSDFFTYVGSLTHPPCLSGLRWVVFSTAIRTNYRTWERFAFGHSEFSYHNYVAGNYRPLKEVFIKADIRLHANMRFIMKEEPLDQKQMDRASVRGYVWTQLKQFPLYYSVRVSRTTNYPDKMAQVFWERPTTPLIEDLEDLEDYSEDSTRDLRISKISLVMRLVVVLAIQMVTISL